MLEHTIRLHTCKTIYLNLSLVTCIFLHGIYYVVNFILFSRENDDMESSKRCVKLLSLIFIIRCLTKSNLIQKIDSFQIRLINVTLWQSNTHASLFWMWFSLVKYFGLILSLAGIVNITCKANSNRIIFYLLFKPGKQSL